MAIYDVEGRQISDNGYLDTAVVYPMYEDETSTGNMQGGCTDGQYIYYVVYERKIVYKYEILTGTLTSSAVINTLGHANSMAYNHDTRKLYICTMDDAGSIAVVDAGTLAYESTIVLTDGTDPVLTSGIAYDRQNDRYVCSYGADYYLFDATFTYLSTFTAEYPSGYTFQGLETDGTVIFRPMWLRSANVNVIGIYDFSGNSIATITVPVSLELEDVMYDWNGNFYLGINRPNTIGWGLYYAGLMTYLETSAVMQISQIVALTQ